MESALADVRRDIVGGRSLSDSLGRSGLFPDALVSMIKVGEKSARLPRMLEKSGEYYEMEVQHALGQFAASLEPILILFVGLLVGFIIIAAFAPLYTLISRLNI
jgi:type IV pilus assembly protein PilC